MSRRKKVTDGRRTYYDASAYKPRERGWKNKLFCCGKKHRTEPAARKCSKKNKPVRLDEGTGKWNQVEVEGLDWTVVKHVPITTQIGFNA